MFRRLIKRVLGGASQPPPARPQPPVVGPLPHLVLYKYDACPYCRKVLRALDRLGIDVEMQDTRQDPEARRALRAKTGRTQVPCLFIDGEPMFESDDIIDWLEAQVVEA